MKNATSLPLAWFAPKQNTFKQYAVVVPDCIRYYMSGRTSSLILDQLKTGEQTSPLSLDALYAVDALFDHTEDFEHNMVVTATDIDRMLTLLNYDCDQVLRRLELEPQYRSYFIDSLAMLDDFRSHLIHAIEVFDIVAPVFVLPFQVLLRRVCKG